MASFLHLPLKSCMAALGLTTLLVAGLGAVGSANAQTTPTLRIVSPEPVLEGNSGTRIMRFTITLDAVATREISGRFLTRQGTLFGDAIQGASCTGETDFIAVDQPFLIPAGSLSTTADVLICGDTQPESTGVRELVKVTLSIPFGTQCPLSSCAAAGVILGDDVPGTLTINSTSVSRSNFVSRTTQLPVRLSLPFGLPTTVNFTTSNGTAQGVQSCGNLLLGNDYVTTSGTITFLPGQTEATLPIRVCANLSAREETFTVRLSNPSAPATIFRGSATITLLPASDAKVGVFAFSPDDARIKVDEPVDFALEWTMPPGQVWRDLSNIGMRLRGDKKTLLWVNWNESSNLFSLCQRHGVRVGAYQLYGQGSEADSDDDAGEERETLAVSCSAGALPGSNTVLETRHARLHLDRTRVVGSGPTGASVMLHLSVSFKPGARGKTGVELAASDDSGRVDSFVRAANLKVVRHQDD